MPRRRGAPRQHNGGCGVGGKPTEGALSAGAGDLIVAAVCRCRKRANRPAGSTGKPERAKGEPDLRWCAGEDTGVGRRVVARLAVDGRRVR